MKKISKLPGNDKGANNTISFNVAPTKGNINKGKKNAKDLVEFDYESEGLSSDSNKKKKKDKKKKDKKKNKDSSNRQTEDEMKGSMTVKQRLYDNIMQFLTIPQKKGIIPIVQDELSKLDPENFQQMNQQNQKFEFDLFSLPAQTCQRLEIYVNQCMEENVKNPGLKYVQDQGYLQITDDVNKEIDAIQDQIDEKLRENKMNVEDKNNLNNPEGATPGVAGQETVPAVNNNILFYDMNNVNQLYEGDKHKLIEKIGLLDTNQLRGIVPIVRNYQM